MAYTTIDKPDDYFNTKLYTGTGSTQSITGVGFQPDWVWIKNRSRTDYHSLYDVVRGVTNEIYTNGTFVEYSNANALTAFGSDGFTVGSANDVNFNGSNIVSWNWLANGTGVSNTAGSITSTVSANTTSGFSIVSYTGTGSNATVGHGLGVAPAMIIVKSRSNATSWQTFHKSLGATKAIVLNSTGTPDTNILYWNNTEPTSSLFTIGAGTDVNGSTRTYIAYCFAELKGFSKFGSYTGNGSADGTFVYTGFKPAYIMMKRTSTGGNSWRVYDNKRDPFNEMDNALFPDSSAVEGDYDAIDFVSNGFKWRNSSAAINGSGSTYIYMAFAENPFVTSTSIPTTAR
jgi:hypothetical protein